MQSNTRFNTILEIIEDICLGKMVILMDDEDRENEGDLIMAASHVSPEDINFMITHARGLVCLTLTQERCKRLDLPSMIDKNKSKFSTNFTVSIEAAEGVSTGISASDRAKTILAAVSESAKPSDIVKPGHIFPIMAQEGGVLSRAGHTEAGCDLARLAGLEPAAVIVEIIKEDGEMARLPDLEIFAKQHGLKIGTIADLIKYRFNTERTINEIKHYPVSTSYGKFMAYIFTENNSTNKHIALVKGDPKEGVTTVRIHNFNPLKDLLTIDGLEDSNHWSIQAALKEISNSERGIFVLIESQDFIDVSNELNNFITYNDVINKHSDQSYKFIGVGSQILKHLGASELRLLSSPLKFNGLSGFGLDIIESVLPC